METTLQDTLQFAELFGSMVAFVEDKEIEYDLPTSMEISTFLAAVAFLKDIDDDKAFLAISNEVARAIVKGEFYLDNETIIKKDKDTFFVDFVSYLLSTINAESFATTVDGELMKLVSSATKKGYEERDEAHIGLCESIFKSGDDEFDMAPIYDDASNVLKGFNS